MLDVYKAAIANQFAVAYSTLEQTVDRCPDQVWHSPVVNITFAQATFHVLFFSDLYLGRDLESFRKQPFHQTNAAFFADYEELEDRAQQATYSKNDIRRYLQFCCEKADDVIAGETIQSLREPSKFDWHDFTRCEAHMNNLRHLFHHAAQLSMRLRIDCGEGVSWVPSGARHP